MRNICRVVAAVAAAAMTVSLEAQSIFTVAGGGSTDGRIATTLSLGGVGGIATDAQGNVYFSEPGRNVVHRLDVASGTLNIYAGNSGGSFSGDGGRATKASLKNPLGLTFDDAGNLYIADHDNNRIRKVDAKSGTITTIAGVETFPGNIGDNGAATQAWVSHPRGLAWDRGSLYIAQDGYTEMRVRKIAPDGTITTIAGTGPEGFTGDGGAASQAQLSYPSAVTVDAAGNVYIADSANNRIRRIDAATGTIDTVVGNSEKPDYDDPSVGDDGPGTSAKLFYPLALAFDPNGKLYIADTAHSRVRRYDPVSKLITTVIGKGDSGDGGLAKDAGVYTPYALAFDKSGNLFVHDNSRQTVRRVDAVTTIITTVAGGGDFVGDGLLATNALLSGPHGVVLDAQGNLYIADAYHSLVRKVDAATGLISTFAGKLNTGYSDAQEGIDVKDSIIFYPTDLAINAAGEIFILSAGQARIYKVDLQGKLSTYAGGGSPPDSVGDGGAATSAEIVPIRMALDAAGNLYISDVDNYPSGGKPTRHRIRRVDAQTKTIRTVAGGATAGFSGDGGDAAAALLNTPNGIAIDGDGNIFVSDYGNYAIRRIDGKTNVITTYAGRGNPPQDFGDGLTATEARVAPRALVTDRKTGDLYVADDNYSGSRIRKIDGHTRIITTVAGPSGVSQPDFSGDNGKATDARLNFLYESSGLALDPNGTLYIADTLNHRVRAVFGCVSVAAPRLTAPASGASASVSPVLTWQGSVGAFRYDVYLDTIANPQRLVASDLDKTTLALSNLAPETTYFWRVVAKGDPFCPTSSSASSAPASFKTSSRCGASAFDAIGPADGAQIATASVLLTWNASPGTSTYDVFLSPFNPPVRLAAGITDTSYRADVAAGSYSWFVVAHASCDASQTASTPLRTFTVSVPNNCPATFTVSTTSPANAAADVPQSADLTWSANGTTTSYDLYLGPASDPPLYASNIVPPRQFVASLESGTKYSWRVAAHTPCTPAVISSPTASFTTRACSAPGATSILFAPQTVNSGATYSIVWSQAAGLDSAGAYLLERSATQDFQSILDSQVISSTAASFIAGAPGAVYHRVRAVSGCDPSKSGSASDAVRVSIVAAPPNVVFTVQPAAKIIDLGSRLEEASSTFTLENIGSSAVQVIVGRQEINSSPPFFNIIDPEGRDAAFVTLDPHKPHTFLIRYSGPPNTVAASYQGVVFVAATGTGLPVTPYAFVNLKVGGAVSAAPQFVVDGSPSEVAAFPGYAGDDTNRPPLVIGVRNPGSTPIEVGFEVGPEVWLTTDATWNASSIAGGTTRSVNLSTRRSRAPNGSALPRYTYLTVRTRDGAATRLLVQDNGDFAVASGRPARLDAGVRSFIVPEAVSRQTARGVVASRVRLSNVGSDPVQVQMIFTPAGADGFDPAAVRRVTVVVPPNDVVTLTDPIVNVFKLTRPAAGQIEVRLPAERVGLVNVSASNGSFSGSGSVVIPIANRGEGARSGAPQTISGITKSSTLGTAVVFTETTGNDHAVIRARLRDVSGNRIGGDLTADVPRYGYVRLDDVVASANTGNVDQATLEIEVTSGGGVVSGTAILSPTGNDGGTAISSRPTIDTSASSALASILRGGRIEDTPTQSLVTVVPLLGTPVSSGSAPSYRTLVGFSASSGAAASFIATLYRGGLTNIRQTVAVPAGTTRVFNDVLGELFGQPSSANGTILVQAPSVSRVYAVVQTIGLSGSVTLPPAALPLPTTLSEALTSAATSAQRPLFVDGLEQSTDPARGSRWLLLLNEVAGFSGVVNVRLYEASNRSVPIAEKNVTIGAWSQIQLDTVFGELGLDTADRRKDRTNVQCVVTAQSGSARVAASAIGIDNVTGATQVIALTPSVGSATPSASLVTPVISTVPTTPTRRRSARH